MGRMGMSMRVRMTVHAGCVLALHPLGDGREMFWSEQQPQNWNRH